MDLQKYLKNGLQLLDKRESIVNAIDFIEKNSIRGIQLNAGNNSLVVTNDDVVLGTIPTMLKILKSQLLDTDERLKVYKQPAVAHKLYGSVTLIACVGNNWSLGLNGLMPWGDVPKDGQHFMNATVDKVVVMGRKTFESLPKKLMGRKAVVVLSRGMIGFNDVENMSSPEEVLRTYPNEEIMVCGGKQIYEAFMPYATKILLTVLDHEYRADTYFVQLDNAEWQCMTVERAQGMRFETWERC